MKLLDNVAGRLGFVTQTEFQNVLDKYNAFDEALATASANTLFAYEVAPTRDQARALPAWVTCINFLSRIVSEMPLKVHNDDKDKTQTAVHRRVERIWNTFPGTKYTGAKAQYFLISQMYDYGVAYFRLKREGTALVTSIEPYHYDRVKKRRDGNYTLKKKGKKTEIVNPEDMLVFEYPGGDPPLKCDAKTAVNYGLLIQAYAKYGFTRNPLMQFYVQETPEGDLSSAEMRRYVDRFIASQVGLSSIGNTPIMPKDMSLNPLDIKINATHIILADREASIKVCQSIGLMPGLVGLNVKTVFGRAEYMEQLAIFLETTLGPLLRSVTDEMKFKMLSLDDEGLMRFDPKDLLKADFKTQVGLAVEATGGPVLTPDEGREMVDKESTPGGDTLRDTTTNTGGNDA